MSTSVPVFWLALFVFKLLLLAVVDELALLAVVVLVETPLTGSDAFSEPEQATRNITTMLQYALRVNIFIVGISPDRLILNIADRFHL